jgi:hypothetical protein
MDTQEEEMKAKVTVIEPQLEQEGALGAACLLVNVPSSKIFSAEKDALNEAEVNSMLGLAADLIFRAADNDLRKAKFYAESITGALTRRWG